MADSDLNAELENLFGNSEPKQETAESSAAPSEPKPEQPARKPMLGGGAKPLGRGLAKPSPKKPAETPKPAAAAAPVPAPKPAPSPAPRVSCARWAQDTADGQSCSRSSRRCMIRAPSPRWASPSRTLHLCWTV